MCYVCRATFYPSSVYPLHFGDGPDKSSTPPNIDTHALDDALDDQFGGIITPAPMSTISRKEMTD